MTHTSTENVTPPPRYVVVCNRTGWDWERFEYDDYDEVVIWMEGTCYGWRTRAEAMRDAWDHYLGTRRQVPGGER